MRTIRIARSAAAVDSIQLEYGIGLLEPSVADKHGGNGGRVETYNIPMGVTIQAIHMVKGKVCDSEIIVGM